MKTFLPLRLLAGLAWLIPLSAAAQTILVELDFENPGNRLTQTGSASTVFSVSAGSLTYATGVNGGTAAGFDGSSSLRADSSPVTSALTITFWMKTTSSYGGGTQWFQGAGIVDGELGGDTTDWGTSVLGDKLAFGIGSSDRTLFSTRPVNTGEWIFVAATWDTSGAMSLYLDGALESTTELGSTSSRRSDNQFFIGQDLGGGAYTGSLDQIRIYDTALSAGQVSAVYAASIPEPSTYAALAGLAALAIAARRRRAN